MVFQQEDLQLQLLDVLYFDDGDIVNRTKGRPFCALSLRMEGDTQIVPNRGQTVRIGTHDLAFFPADFGYNRISHGDRRIVFHFTILNHMPYELEILRDFRYDVLYPLFSEALRLWNERKPGFRYRVSAILYEIFSVIREESGQPSKLLSPPIAAAVYRINEAYMDPALTVAALAAASHMSETYFRTLFRRELGVCPKKYLLDLRLEHAQGLLNAGYDPVTVIAEKVGFRDAKNFSTSFRKRFGYPPSAQHYAVLQASLEARNGALDEPEPEK